MLAQLLLKVLILQAAEAVDAFAARHIVSIPPGQLDAAPFEKRRHTIVTWLAIDKAPVVQLAVERNERYPFVGSVSREEIVEQTFPGCCMHLGGLCQDTVQVEKHR